MKTTDKQIDDFLSTLKIHNRNIDACFNDALAVAHLKTLLHQERERAVLSELEILRSKMRCFPPNGIYESSMFAVTVNDIDERIAELRAKSRELNNKKGEWSYEN